MMPTRSVLPWLGGLSFCLLFLGRMAGAMAAGEPSQYETGFHTIAKLEHDLCSVLEPKIRGTLNPQPLWLEKVQQPYLQPLEYFDGVQKLRVVALSAGFVELLNSFSHARALNNMEPGYLNQYLSLLAGQEEISPLCAVQVGARERLWGFNTMNVQMSQFNQIAGALLAINLAHHYLGHYQKYAGQLMDAQNQPVPIASVISAGEWREAVQKGARHGLQCGLGVGGLKGFYEGLANLPTRPGWVANFLPKDADLIKIKKDLDKVEKAFFLSGR